MVVPVRKKGATYEDLLALPENLVGEIVDDELFASPRPRSRHARVSSVLGQVMGRFDSGGGGPGGWWIIFEPELHLGRDVMVPDLAGWRRERMPEFPDRAYFDLAPDWVCEVLSPGTAQLDLVKKLPRYARAGVAHAWIIDPEKQFLQVFRAEQEKWVLAQSFSEEEKIRAEPFDAVDLNLRALWL